MTKDEAARRVGLSRTAFKRWNMEGKVGGGQLFAPPGGGRGRHKLYPVEEIQRLVRERRDAPPLTLEPDGAGDYRPPQGYVDWRGACALLGIMKHTLHHWQSQGRIPGGVFARFPEPDAQARRRVYPVDEIRRLAEELSQKGQPYPDPERPKVWRVPVTTFVHGTLEALVDEADVELVRGKRWNWHPPNSTAQGIVSLATATRDQPHLKRLVLGLEGPQWRIDHANGNPLDCRRENLIVRSHTEQMAHARKRRTNGRGKPCTSRFKGVCWDEKCGKWRAQVQKEGCLRPLGTFHDEIAAAQAYDEAASELFGEHARLNFPDGVDAWLEAEAMANERAKAA